MRIAWEAAGGTDVGLLREGNEDAFRMDPDRGIFLVADGMGGHAAGEIASALAADAVAGSLAEAYDAGVGVEEIPEALQRAVHAAHGDILAYCAQHRAARGMGTTLTACVVTPDGACRIAHVGDSRLYRLRDRTLEQLTHDHTWVQREVDAGRLSPAAARRHSLSHILTRVLTDDPAPPEIDLPVRSVAPGDLLLLMTDGLYNMLDDGAIAEIVSLAIPLPARVQALIDAANGAGGADNITAVLVHMVEG